MLASPPFTKLQHKYVTICTCPLESHAFVIAVVVVVVVVVAVAVVVVFAVGFRVRGSAVRTCRSWNHEPWRRYRGLPACAQAEQTPERPATVSCQLMRPRTRVTEAPCA